MKWLFYENETSTRAKVILIYSVEPPEELISNGNYITVDSYSEAERQVGKSALPYCNPQTGEFWYEYVDRTLTPEEKLESQQEQIDQLTIMLGDVLLEGGI